jgi:glycosyltransferase involved in cell wall biosynthesis
MAPPTGQKRTVLLYGPSFGRSIPNAYGGGTGGYGRNMDAYLKALTLPNATFIPLYHTIRGEQNFGTITPIVRMFIDTWRIIRALILKRPAAVHVLAVYNDALPREFVLALLCMIFRVTLIYDVKAGNFIEAYEQRGALYRAMVALVVRSAALVLVEGRVYIDFMSRVFSRDARYFPNFVPDSEIPDQVPRRFQHDTTRVLFVGYCQASKGVMSLLEGCATAAAMGARIEVVLVGAEEASFTKLADEYLRDSPLRVLRMGRLPHDSVIEMMLTSDVYCYPTTFVGEGHNNSINEAMMCQLTIVTTRHGFLSDVLGPDCAVFLDNLSAESIAHHLLALVGNREESAAYGKRARARLMSDFTSTVASRLLSAYYGETFGADQAKAVRG